MMNIAIIIPTIKGREQDLARCIKAYERTAPEAKLYIEHNQPSCGQAWVHGADFADRQRGFDYLGFTADDLEPHHGWLKPALETVDAGMIPAPLVFSRDGSLDSAGLEDFGQYRGPYTDWQHVQGTTVPFLTREMWERISALEGVRDLLASTHYTTDLLVSQAGRQLGWETVIRPAMRFTHYVAEPGRNYGRAPSDTQAYLQWERA